MKSFAHQLALMLLCVACAFSQERYSKVGIPVSSREDVIMLARLGISLEGTSFKPGRHIEVYVSESEIQRLKDNGIAFSILIPDWKLYYTERQRQESPLGSQLLRASQLKNFHLGSMGGFLTLEEMVADLDSMRAKYPALVTSKDSIGASYEKRPIWAVRITKNPIPGSQPQALYMGCHHADEAVGMMSVIYFMWHLLETYGTDPEVTTLLDSRELWFIPIVNPDGYRYNQLTNPSGGGLWRKNRHPLPDGRVGIDLNRNYGFKWGLDDIGSSPLTSYYNYRGPAPFSEPETQVIRDFVNAHHFTMAHSFHAFGDFVAPPWAYSCTETPDSVLFRALEVEMTAANRYSFGAEFPYTCNGEAGDWLYGDTLSKPKIYPFTIEVGADADGAWPPLSRILPLVMENVRTNLVLAHAAGEYIKINKTAVTYQFNTDSAIVSVPFVNSGAGTQSTTLDVKVSCPELDLVSTHFPGYSWGTAGPLAIHARKNKPVGTKVMMFFEVRYGGGMTLDTLTFRLGPAKVIYADDAEGTRSRWLASSNLAMVWDTTNTQAHSGRLSFSESPHSVYANNLVSTFTLDSGLVLKGSAAELRFWLKGRSEENYDCLRVELSPNNGVTWYSLEGRYTSPGSGAPTEVPFQSPVLDGYKYEWIEEVMDLGAFVGNTVKIRFRFTSDNGLAYDGFFIDDLRVLVFGSMAYAHNPQVWPLAPKANRDTLHVRAIVENPGGHPLVVNAVIADLASGQLQDSLRLWNDGLHNDGLINDSLWAGGFVPRVEGAYSVSLRTDDATDATSSTLPKIGFFNTAGPVICAGDTSNKAPQWGLTVAYRFKIGNTGTTAATPAIEGKIRSLDTAAAIVSGNPFAVGDIAPGQVRLSSLIGISLSRWCTGTRDLPLELVFSSNAIEYWRDTVTIRVADPTGFAQEQNEIPTTYDLDQNYPNPFNPSTTIRFVLPTRSHVALTVFNTLGQDVAQLVNGDLEAGFHEVTFDGSGLSSGVYFYRLRAGDFLTTKRMLVLK
jgi:hypothetical protein